MNQSTSLQHTPQNIDPNENQLRASHPRASVWVSASAGTGKTKVLADRFLRLMLPSFEKNTVVEGTEPEKILCLTYTKAGASNMAERIQNILSHWAVCDENTLIKELQTLIGQNPNQAMIDRARQLFARIADKGGDLKIMTIHAFCQSLLGRFPLEAGISPNFDIADDATQYDLQHDSYLELLKNTDHDPNLGPALDKMIADHDISTLENIIKHIAKNQNKVLKLIEGRSIKDIEQQTQKDLGYPHLVSKEDIQNNIYNYFNNLESEIKSMLDKISQAQGATTIKFYNAFSDWLALPIEQRKKNLSIVENYLLTKDGLPRKTLITKRDGDEQTLKQIETLQADYWALKQEYYAACILEQTLGAVHVAKAYLKIYNRLKKERNLMDYADQVRHTLELLSQDHIAPWILYKIDHGIEHVLIDEAQDTSPEQWDIIRKLTTDFFSGLGANDIQRTIFAVGDIKQSIYSFQGAEPQGFIDMREYYKAQVLAAQQNWESLPMIVNFRSSSSILASVDTVFQQPDTHAATLEETTIQHQTFKDFKWHAGTVELWPVFEQKSQKSDGSRYIPTTLLRQPRPDILMCTHIATTIKSWLNEKRVLDWTNAPIEPRDIMILVRKRGTLMQKLVNALKKQNIPVAGIDKMRLNEQLSVKDVMALIQFTLNPDDDLNTAICLKTPIINLNDQELEDLCLNRHPKTLWMALRESQNERLKDIADYLKSLEDKSAYLSPYDVVDYLIHAPCPADAVSGRRAFLKRLGTDCLDPLQELLNQTLHYERQNKADLQSFIHWILNSDTDIKRELSDDAQSNEVRILTAHGSKGLEAPIVFLPDTTDAPQSESMAKGFMWSDQGFYWGASRMVKTVEATQSIHDSNQKRQMDEYYRLLYVAMTRAKEHLIVTGQKSNTVKEDTWYGVISSALKNHPDITPQDFDAPPSLHDMATTSYILHNATGNDATREQSQEVKAESKSSISYDTLKSDYSWIFEQAEIEQPFERPLRPSRPDIEEASVDSPLQRNDDERRFWRGNVIHTLLQSLPDLPKTEWESAITQYLSYPSIGASPKAVANITKELLAVMNNPEFAAVFGPKSRAEVPISGSITLRGQPFIVNGQIDRLAETDEDILIIDYKTNRPASETVETIPKEYLHQMATYRELIKTIYPDKNIKTAILWTYSAELMVIPNAVLNKLI